MEYQITETAMFEKNRIRDKIKELLTLASFTLAVAFCALIVMNILVYPITIFALHDMAGFNAVFKKLPAAFAIVAAIGLSLRRVFTMKKEGYTAGEINWYFLRKIYSYIIFITSLTVTFIAGKKILPILFMKIRDTGGAVFGIYLTLIILLVIGIFCITVFLLMFLMHIKMFFRLRSMNIPFKDITKEIFVHLYRPFYYSIIAFFFITLTVAIVSALYFLLNQNFYYLYKLTSN